MSVIAASAPLADVDWGHMGDWSAGSWLAMIAFWALLAFLLVWLVRELAGSRSEGAPADATEILDRRLAAGEIGVDEYRERRAVLRGESTSEGA